MAGAGALINDCRERKYLLATRVLRNSRRSNEFFIMQNGFFAAIQAKEVNRVCDACIVTSVKQFVSCVARWCRSVVERNKGFWSFTDWIMQKLFSNSLSLPKGICTTDLFM